VAVAVGPRDECEHRFGFCESRQIIEVAVVPIGEQRIAVPRDLWGRRYERKPAAAGAHGLQQRVAPLAVDLVCVVHRGILHVDRAL
jgi:hypothetical protein